jgi:methionyl-tRNA formyltransferase
MKILIISKNSFWSKDLVCRLKKSNHTIKFSDTASQNIFNDYKPDWTFFFHWSKIVSKEIYSTHKCCVVHTSNLPQGRGGTPIQNQILEKVNESKVNIIEMADEVDAGGIYCSQPITLQGDIASIWLTISRITSELILECVNLNLKSFKQEGEVKVYKRVKSNKLIVDGNVDISSIYDQIRMVDHETYPNAFLNSGNFVFEFTRAKLNDNEVVADVKIKTR